VTPPDLPTWSLVSSIDPSPHDPATAYLAIERHRHDDFAPYLYKTHDYGQSWEKIVTGLPGDDFTRVLRADPMRPGLLYAGTEAGVWVSRDDGASWQSLRRNLPVVPIHDLVVKNGDLVAATHGRGFWILDDLTPLRESNAETLTEAARLFPPRPTIRYRTVRGFGGGTGPGKTYQLAGTTGFAARWQTLPNGDKDAILLDAGKNPPDGVIIYYQLDEAHTDDLALTFLDSAGDEIATYRGKRAGEEPQPKVRYLPTEGGLNRFVWEGRYPDARDVPGAIYRSSGVAGPLAPPSEYRVRLSCGEESWTQAFTLQKDPRSSATDAELQEQFAFLLEIRDKLSEANDAIVRLRTIREQVGLWEARARREGDHEELIAAAEELKKALGAVEEGLIQTRWKSSRDALTAPSKLNVKIATLLGVVGGADAAPTTQAREVFASVGARVDAQLAELAALLDREIPRFNDLVRDAAFPALAEPVTTTER